MRELFAFILFGVLVIVGFVGTIYGLCIINSAWNCSSIRKLDSVEARVVAGDCLVKENNRWILYHDYVSRDRHQLEMKSDGAR